MIALSPAGPMVTADEVFDRIKDIYGFMEDRELAKFLHTIPSMISRRRAANTLPYKRIVQYCAMRDLNYIFYGDTHTNNPARTVVLDVHLPEGVEVDMRTFT